MKIAILGKGYIGNYLAKAKTNHEIIHHSKRSLDYSNFSTFKEFLVSEKPEYIVNTSGFTGKPNVDACEDQKAECFKYNVEVPILLTKAANKMRIPIIHIGSGCIYNGYDKEFTEEDPSNFGIEQHYSSFYSKTKDIFEKLTAHMDRYIFRIRIPFNSVAEPKNYLWKLLNYNNLINMKNSLTNIDELVDFTYKFISCCCFKERPPTGVYNVVNNGTINAQEVVDLLKENNLENPNWNFVSLQDANFRVARSNCILSTKKINDLGLGLSDIKTAMKKAIENYNK
jgi:dTDP-4-dehydrorhamnose reductase